MTLSMQLPSAGTVHDVVIEIGGFPIEVQTTDAEFERILRGRYGDYIKPGLASQFALQVEVSEPDSVDPDADAEVWLEGREWKMVRGDFSASWNPDEHRGQVHQTANPYSIDSVLAHRTYIEAGVGGRVPVARLQRGSQWQGVFVFRRVGGGKDDDGPPGSA